MSELRKLSETDRTIHLRKMGAALSLSAVEVDGLNVKCGAEVTELMLKLVAHRRTLGTGLTASLFDLGMLKQLFVDFLTSHKGDIEKWIDEGEGVIYDTVVALVGARNTLLAALLARYKDTVVGIDDTATADAIDSVIAILKGQSAE